MTDAARRERAEERRARLVLRKARLGAEAAEPLRGADAVALEAARER